MIQKIPPDWAVSLGCYYKHQLFLPVGRNTFKQSTLLSRGCDYTFWLLKKKILFTYYLERRGGRETSLCKRYMDWLSHAHPQLGTQLITQACALTGNRTSDLLVCRPALNPPSHTSQGPTFWFNSSQNPVCLGPNEGKYEGRESGVRMTSPVNIGHTLGHRGNHCAPMCAASCRIAFHIVHLTYGHVGCWCCEGL